MKAKLKKEFEGKGVTVHVQTRPGFGRAIELDRATEKQLLYLLEMKHPAVTEDRSAPKEK
jgi:hypothetical protein